MRNTSYRILADGETMSNDTWHTQLNNNDLIIGPSGSGKTRGYVKPNILQCNESMIIADTKGSLRKEVGSVLEQEGYEVLEVDFTDCLHSPYGYNPLSFIRYDAEREKYNEQDVLRIAECLVPIEDFKAPFWDMAARMYLASLIGYTMEALPEDEHVMYSLIRLLRTIESGDFKNLIRDLERVDPDSLAVTLYKMFKVITKADKMDASIQGIVAEKLAIMAFDGARAMCSNPKQIDFVSLGREKKAVFLCISDTDRSLDRLANLFYTQALQTLCNSADKDYADHRLPVPVRFILDDFAANVYIPDFDKMIAVIRSREIYVSIILQSISQLEDSYGYAKALTILNNCDNLLYLGGQDVETARYISVKANCSIHKILEMPLDGAMLFTRGSKPKAVHKFRLEKHERYKQTEEGREMAI